MNRIKQFLNSDKNRRLIILLVAFTGIILILLPSFTENKPQSSESYGDMLEEKLKSIIECVTGEDTIEVMITFKNEYGSQNGETDLFSALSEKDDGLQECPYPKISGVMIVCKGITDKGDFDIIKRASATALGTDPNNIYIIGGVTQ